MLFMVLTKVLRKEKKINMKIIFLCLDILGKIVKKKKLYMIKINKLFLYPISNSFYLFNFSI